MVRYKAEDIEILVKIHEDEIAAYREKSKEKPKTKKDKEKQSLEGKP